MGVVQQHRLLSLFMVLTALVFVRMLLTNRRTVTRVRTIVPTVRMPTRSIDLDFIFIHTGRYPFGYLPFVLSKTYGVRQKKGHSQTRFCEFLDKIHFFSYFAPFCTYYCVIRYGGNYIPLFRCQKLFNNYLRGVLLTSNSQVALCYLPTKIGKF